MLTHLPGPCLSSIPRPHLTAQISIPADVAQLVEQSLRKGWVVGSNPTIGSIHVAQRPEWVINPQKNGLNSPRLLQSKRRANEMFVFTLIYVGPYKFLQTCTVIIHVRSGLNG